MMRDETAIIYSIGHGRQSFAAFLALLQKFEIEFVCDVRSAARSRWPQFNERILRHELANHNIGYEHLPECGGKVLAKSEDLQRGIERILELSAELKTAMMCSESKPLTNHKQPRANCHRVGLLAPLLKRNGTKTIIHILPDGAMLEFDEKAVLSIW